MQLHGLTLNDNEDLSSLVNRLKSMCTQLVYLNAPMEEEDKVAILLKSLPPSYHHLVTVLKEKDPLPTLEDSVNSLQAEEKKMHIDLNTSTRAHIVSSSSRFKCKHCGKSNHQS